MTFAVRTPSVDSPEAANPSNRYSRLGSSDAWPAISGIRARRSYLAARGEAEPEAPSIAMEVGKALEPIVVRRALERLLEQDSIDAGGYEKSLAHYEATRNRPLVVAVPRRPWLQIHPDALVFRSKSEASPSAKIEAKAINVFRRGQFGDDASDGLPDEYLAQIYAQQAAFPQIEVSYGAVLFGNQELRLFSIERNNEAIDGVLKALDELWGRIIHGSPPPLSVAEAKQEWPEPDPDSYLVANAEDLLVMRALAKAQTQEKAAKTEVDRLKGYLATRLEDKELLVQMTTDKKGKTKPVPLFTCKRQERKSYVVEASVMRVARLTAAGGRV